MLCYVLCHAGGVLQGDDASGDFDFDDDEDLEAAAAAGYGPGAGGSEEEDAVAAGSDGEQRQAFSYDEGGAPGSSDAGDSSSMEEGEDEEDSEGLDDDRHRWVKAGAVEGYAQAWGVGWPAQTVNSGVCGWPCWQQHCLG